MKEYIIQFDEEANNVPTFIKEQFLGLYSDRELIRCKDCIWNKGGEWVDCYMSGMHGRTSNKNYCSRAERRNNETV